MDHGVDRMAFETVAGCVGNRGKKRNERRLVFVLKAGKKRSDCFPMEAE